MFIVIIFGFVMYQSIVVSVLHMVICVIAEVAASGWEAARRDVVLVSHMPRVMMLAMMLAQLVMMTIVVLLMLLGHMHPAISLVVLAVHDSVLALVAIVGVHGGVEGRMAGRRARGRGSI
jgi:hypothetical protein